MVNHSGLYQKIILVMMRSKHHLSMICEEFNITPVQGILLTSIQPGEQKSMNELSSVMACDASNITGLVDKLDQNKFISRTPDKEDRRIKIVALTEKGEVCREKILVGLKNAEALDMKKLSDQESQELYKLLGKLL